MQHRYRSTVRNAEIAAERAQKNIGMNTMITDSEGREALWSHVGVSAERLAQLDGRRACNAGQ